MNRPFGRFVLIAGALLLSLAGNLAPTQADSLASPSSAATLSLGTAFTYQGQLLAGNTPVTDSCNLRFRLFDAASAGSQIGATQTLPAVAVSAGLFTVSIDFGQAAFDGNARWLEIAAQCTGDADFTVLAPRQPLTPAPYALALPGLYTQQNATSPNLIGGYSANVVTTSTVGATIGGGGSFASGANEVTDNFGTVGGGANNQAGNNAGPSTDATFATVGGGLSNLAGEIGTTVGGGNSNAATGEHATVGGGSSNVATANRSTVAGGQSNEASGEASTVAGGNSNVASGFYAAVTGGADNLATGQYTHIGGGNTNEATNPYGTIGGGLSNETTGQYATVAGGDNNTAGANWSVISGGGGNQVANVYGVVGGGQGNITAGDYSVVGGGFTNATGDSYAVVGGGNFNDADGFISVVGGGAINAANGDYSTIPGGTRAVASHYGELAYASGRFAANGDAQTSVFVLRGTSTAAAFSELFLDGVGGSQRLTIPNNTTWSFNILIAGRTTSGPASGGYQITGVIYNDGGTTSFQGTPTVTVLGEEVAAWDVQVTADSTLDALTISAKSTTGVTARWVARVETVQVTF